MKRALFAVLGLLLAFPALAQVPQEDPRINIYRQLLSEANDRLATSIAQNGTLSTENAQLKAQIVKLKPPSKEEPKPAPK